MEQYGSQIERVTSTVTAAGTTTLVNTSACIEVFTGTMTQMVQLPVATSYTKAGGKFEIYNRSTVSISVNYQDATLLQVIPASSSLIVKLVDNSTANGLWVTLSNSAAPAVQVPTIQTLLSGSGTYTTPISPSPLYLKVRMVGGGGGGGGPSGGASAGGTGGQTSFGGTLLVANGGTGGGAGAVSGSGGSGGTVSNTAGPLILVALSGGSAASTYISSPSSGAMGAPSPFGGAGGSSNSNAVANSGSGGGGGGGSGGGASGGPGGGCGGYIEAIIPSPSATYSYSIGTAGASAGSGAGIGGSGVIIVEAYYS